MKKTVLVLTALLAALSLAACTSESSSSTSFHVTTTTDEGTKEYDYKAEEKNGEVTTESSVTETPAGDEDPDPGKAGKKPQKEAKDKEDAEESSEEYETADVIDEEETDEEIDPAVMEEAEWIDGLLTEQWDQGNDGHSVSVDPDAIYAHIWSEGASTVEDLNEEEFRESIIPSWIETAEEMRVQFEEDGLGDLHLTIQYLSDVDDAVFFTIEDEELVYFVFD